MHAFCLKVRNPFNPGFIVMRRLYLSLFVLLVGGWAQAQERIVTGTVAATEDGSLLPGSNVILKGTTQGVVTDINGFYTITVPGPDAVLTYSFTGRVSQDKAVGDLTVINITLANATQELNEVVVTGVAISRDKRSLGYGVQTVGGDQITSSRESNVVNALNSKVAGVQVTSSSGTPGASASIRIRGTNSISGDYQPLFVIDGVPIDNSENASAQERDGNVPFTQGVNNSNRAVDINPQDVETITVLKGPAAAAIYGIRAANGAVIITTKKGKNSPGGKINVTLSSRFSLDQVNRLPDEQKVYSQGSGDVYQGPASGTSASWGGRMDTLYYTSDPSNSFYQGRNIVGKSQPHDGPLANTYNPTKDFFQTGVTYDNNLSLSGGSEKSTFYASVNRYTQTGIIPNTDFKKTSVRFTASTQVSSKLELTGSINYINSGGNRAQQGSNTSGIMLGLLRTPINFDNSNGIKNAESHSDAYLLADGRQRSYRANPNKATYDNPYFTVARNLTRDNVDRFIGYAQAKYNFTDYLTATYRLGVDAYSDTRRGGYDINSSSYPAGRAFEDRITNRIINQDVILSLHKRYGEFDITAIGGHNIYATTFGRVYTQVDNLGVSDLLTISNGTSIYGYQGNTQLLRFGTYGDVNVGFRDRYYIGVTVRNDWSSTLPAKNNSFLYGTINGGYVFSDDFFKDSRIVNFAKVRASVARVGRDATPQSVKTVYGQGSYSDGYTSGILFPYNNQNGYSLGTTAGSSQPQLGNPNLKPESNTTYETGLEMQFFKNRASFDVNLYFADNRDQIVLAPIPSSSGFQYSTVNSGRLQNKGIEITLNATPVRSPNFRWDITFNYTRNISRVINLANGVDNLFLSGFQGSGVYAIPGQPFSVIYGTAYARASDGKYILAIDQNTGRLSPVIDGAPHILGNPNPVFLMNLRNRFEFYGFFVNTLLDVRIGGDILNSTRGALNYFGRGSETATRGDTGVYKGYIADDKGNAQLDKPATAKVVRDQTWYQGVGSSFIGPNDESVERVSWLRMRELTVGYTFASSLVKRAGLQSVQFSVYARNLFLITNYKGVDPETSLTGTSNGFGLDYFNNPNTKTYGANLVVSF